MSVNIETAAPSMSESLDSLRVTPKVMQPLYRVWFEIDNIRTWYAIINEARILYGKNWRGQSNVRRKLENIGWSHVNSYKIWFDVPDQAFASWISLKYSVISVKNHGK